MKIFRLCKDLEDDLRNPKRFVKGALFYEDWDQPWINAVLCNEEGKPYKEQDDMLGDVDIIDEWCYGMGGKPEWQEEGMCEVYKEINTQDWVDKTMGRKKWENEDK